MTSSTGIFIHFIYRMHNPTTKNQQGGDRGSQYRSVIFYTDAAQKSIAERITLFANEKYGGKVSTTLEPASAYIKGENYHQGFVSFSFIDKVIWTTIQTVTSALVISRDPGIRLYLLSVESSWLSAPNIFSPMSFLFPVLFQHYPTA